MTLRARCVCGWKATGKDWRRLNRRAIVHCEECGGPVHVDPPSVPNETP